MSSTPEPASGSFDILSDDIVMTIGLWVASAGPSHLVMFQNSCRRMQYVLGSEAFVESVIRQQEAPPGVVTLEQLAVYEELVNFGFLQENRIGFGFASVDVDEDDGQASGITGSMDRLESTKWVMKRFPNSSVRLAAHCGIVAPPGIALQFSQARGLTVVDALRDESSEEEESRLELQAWGFCVAKAASKSQHPHCQHARSGKGWVDVFIRIGDLELPARPAYYEGLSEVPEPVGDDRNWIRMFLT